MIPWLTFAIVLVVFILYCLPCNLAVGTVLVAWCIVGFVQRSHKFCVWSIPVVAVLCPALYLLRNS